MNKSILTIATFALTVSTLGITSCGKDNNNNNNNSIIGSWEERREVTKVTNTSTNPPVVVSSTDSAIAAGQGNYIEFRANNTYVSKDNASASSVSDSGSYSYANNKLVVRTAGTTAGDTLNVAFSGNTFTIAITDTSFGYKEEYSVTYNRR